MSSASSVVITGMGVASALGTGCDALWRAVAEGRDGLRTVGRFETHPFGSDFAALWPAWDGRVQDEMAPGRDLETMAQRFPVLEMARVAADEAWAEARLGQGTLDGRRVALVLGTCFGQGFRLFHEVTEALAETLGITGPRLTVSTACSSSTNAVGLARDLLRAGRADVVIAGGVDVLLREVFAGFCALGVVSPLKCAPFSEPPGITLGEGAGFVVLERADGRMGRAAPALAAILGYGLSSDGFHETTPDPSGTGIGRAIRGALRDAGIDGPAIDYVNAHATGTESHDRAEWTAIRQSLGARPTPVPVSATKSYLGHTQGAAGILELIVTVLAMREGLVPPTLRFTKPRPGCPDDPVAGSHPRPLTVTRALSVSAAFGGANAVLAIGAPSLAPRRPADLGSPPREPREQVVVVRGLGAVGPQGAGVEALAAAVAGDARAVGSVAPFDFARIAGSVDPRRLDPSARLLTAAAALALGDAGAKIRGPLRDQTGLFVGATRMPAESSFRCIDSIERHGVAACSASAFARMSVNAPTGACAKLLGLRGPSTTVSAGAASGLLAILLGAEWLAARDDADLLLAGGLDERPPQAFRDRKPEAAWIETEGAACALLAREPSAAVAGRLLVAGWGLAGRGDAAGAAREALADGTRPDGVWGDGQAARRCLAPAVADASDLPCGFVDVAELWVGSEACSSAIAFLLAAHALRSGSARAALAVAARGDSASCAVLLRMEERAQP